MKTFKFLLLTAIMFISTNLSAQPHYILSATTKPYVPVTGGIVPPLITNVLPWELRDEGFAQNIPIGFSFKYEGKSYNKVNINVNGFIALDSTTTFKICCGFKLANNLQSGPSGFGGNRPVIAPFWDDLALFDTLDLVYKTSGQAPFRVFTVEWKKVRWTSNAANPVLSIEAKLYETTNVIEFAYQDEGGVPSAGTSASIGITSGDLYRDFISLQNTSLNPFISLIRENRFLSVKPANNQVYRLIPEPVPMPIAVRSALSYTNHKVSFQFQSVGSKQYEYAVTQSYIPPAAGIRTSSTHVTVSSLSPATTYYSYVRSVQSNGVGHFYSQWICDSFTTAVNPVELPYHVGGDPNVCFGCYPPYLPPNTRLQEIRDTDKHYLPYPNSVVWNIVVDFPGTGDTSAVAFNTFYNFSADTWLFTPGLQLTAGKTYQLKFGYMSFWTNFPEETISLEVKYGTATGAAGMTSGALFKKTDIQSPDFILADTIIEINPDHTGVYYFGFHNLTPAEPGFEFGAAVPIVANISLSEKISLSEVPVTLNGRTNNTDNILSWAIKNNKTNSTFEVQRSTDGINFTKIGSVNTKTVNVSNPIDYNAIIKALQSKINLSRNKNPIAFTESNAGQTNKGIEILRSIQKANASHKNNYNYADHSAKGVNYYRLQLVDKNGTASYSNIVKLETKNEKQFINLYPNPAKDVLNITMQSSLVGKMNMIVTDLSGKILISKEISLSQNANNLQLDVSHLPAGTYFLKINCANGCENAVKKFLKD